MENGNRRQSGKSWSEREGDHPRFKERAREREEERERERFRALLSPVLEPAFAARTENSSSPETCNNGVCSTTSPGEMTSVRTCYCKHEKNAARKKDNDITIHNGNRHPAAVSKKSIVTSRICGNGRESRKRARCVTNEGGTPNTNRSVEAQPSNPILSPETSIALENAEKIINNAKIQLMEVCATSSFDSAQRSRNTYSDEPPLDDEAEERMYVRELVATKFHDTCSSKLSETTGKTSDHSEKRDSPPVTVRRIDLSAPKFRVSRRRRADWSSLGYGSDDRSRERASTAQVLSRDSMGVANESTARDDRARDHRRKLSARGNTCGIQKGPSVHIVDRELTRQDLEDVHISPESSRAQNRANIATYTLHHDVIQNANDPEVIPTTRRVRLDALQREKPIGRLIIEAVTETMPTNSAGMSKKDLEKFTNSESEKDDGRIESSKRKNQNPDPQNAEGMGTSECLKNAMNQGAKCAVIATPRTDRNEKLQNKVRKENHEGIASGDTEIRYAQDGGIFSGRSAAGRLRNDENIVDKIQSEEKQGDRSKPSLAGDTSRKTAFPRRENITCREAESPTPYRTIDGHLSHTFNSHNGQDGLCNVAHRTFSLDVSREEDDLDEADLYRPCLDDLDSILHSNDRKIERVVRMTRNLSALLSGPEFAIYKLNEDERVPQDANHEKLYQDSLADKDNKYSLNEPARSSILETELRNEDLTVSEIQRTDEDPKGTNATGVKSSAGDNSRSRSNYSKNYSVESSVFPASDASDDPKTSRDSDRAQGSAVKARFADSSTDRSDVTTFSNLVPALSSTHTETQCRLPEEKIVPNDRHADAKSRVTSTSKFSKRENRRSGKKYIDNEILPQLSQKDAFQATDRFVAYILQDDKQSLEGKVASALKESAITPATVQKLLDYLREAESIRDARQMETLDILRNILINVKSQPDQGNTNDKETSSRNIPDFSARLKVPPIVIDELTSQGEEAQQTRAKIDANEMERINKNSYELKSPGGNSFDFSEYRERRESVRSTARCASTQNSENNSKRDTGQTKSAEVAGTVSIDAKNQTADKSVNDNSPKKKITLPQNVAGSLIRTDATSNAIEKTILQTQAKNNTSDTGLSADKFEDSKKPDKYFSVSPAFPETRESVRSAVYFEFARGSKNNSKNNSKGNSASEAESLKQISDIRSDDDDENPRENPEHLSTKIASAESRQEREIEAVNSITAIAVSENKKDDISNEKFRKDKSIDANKNQYANKIIAQTKQVTESDIPEEAVKEIKSEKIHDIITPVRVLFALSEVSEIKDEQVRSDASPVRSKFIDKVSRKTDVDLVHSSTKEDPGSLHETKINSRQIIIKEKIDPVDNCSADSPRDCIVKNSESSLQEFPSRNKQISLDNGKDNLIRNKRNEEISKSMTFAAIENRKDRNGSSRLQKTARSDNERQSIDLTERSRNYKIDVLSSSNSSVSSTLLDERSTNGMSSSNARRIGTTPETSHSEGELYMPSSCSYSLGEVRVLRKRDLIEDNGMDRDSSVTVLVTKIIVGKLRTRLERAEDFPSRRVSPRHYHGRRRSPLQRFLLLCRDNGLYYQFVHTEHFRKRCTVPMKLLENSILK